MSRFSPRSPGPDDRLELTPEVREYLLGLVRAARPGRSRDAALRFLGDAPVQDAWDVPPEPVDWSEVEAEARRQGCTVADILYDRAGRRSDPI